MTSYLPCDVAIVAVVPVEFQAVVDALGITTNPNARIRIDGTVYYKGTYYSRLLDRDLNLVVTCIGEASQANAGVAVTKLVEKFAPALTVLIGIAAGMRDKIRIGDVVVPREIADLSVTVQGTEGTSFRPRVTPLSYPVQQMLPAFRLNTKSYHARFKEIFGESITCDAADEAEYQKHVTHTPRVLDNVLASSDVLLKSPTAFSSLTAVHDAIRAAEMEAGGLVKACQNRHPPRAWLVVRGISDFGDTLKNDDFHRLASCAAAVWLSFFLTDAFDVDNISGAPNLEQMEAAPDGGAFAKLPATSSAILSPLAADFVNAQVERISQPLNKDRLRDFESIRELWRTRQDRSALSQLRELKSREEMRFVEATLHAKILRFEASLTLTLEKNVSAAKVLASEADKVDPTGSSETLNAFIVYHESGDIAALDAISQPSTIDGWNLRLALLIESGDSARAVAESQTPPPEATPDTETWRIRALARLQLGDLEGARSAIEHAISLKPEWYNVRYVEAVVCYFESLSPPLFAVTRKDWPSPTDSVFVKRDPATLATLRRAEGIFAELISAAREDADNARSLEGWRLACLCNDAERQSDAQTYCAELLLKFPNHPIALTWATTRGYPIDFGASIDALTAELFPEV